MMKKEKIKAGDLARNKHSGGKVGDVLWLVEFVGENGFYCVIREAGRPLAGGQEFDTSLLVKVDR